MINRISDPNHNDYLQYPTTEEITDILKPKAGGRERVERWLSLAGPHSLRWGLFGDRVTVLCPVSTAERAFGGRFERYRHVKTGAVRVANRGIRYDTAPEDVRLAVGLRELFDPDLLLAAGASAWPGPKVPRYTKADEALKFMLTPSALRYLYNVPAGASSSRPVGIVGRESFFDGASFARYMEEFLPGTPGNITVVLGQADSGARTVTETGDTTAQVLAAVSGAGKVMYWGYGNHPGEFWLSKWYESIEAMRKANEPLPDVVVFTDSFPIDSDCNQNDPACLDDRAQLARYIEVADHNLVLLGAMGITVVATSGSDGAQGRDNIRCPSWVNNDCKRILVTDSATSRQCSLPIAGAQDSVCQELLKRQDCLKSLELVKIRVKDEPCLLHLGPDPTYTVDAKCPCSDISSVDYAGTCAVAGDKPGAEDYFVPEYPASSPYVLSVGTTRLTRFRSPACEEGLLPLDKQVCPMGEITASTDTGSNVTSGGGFGNYTRLDHQARFLDRYATLASSAAVPAGSWDPKRRGYPDVSAIGVRCMISQAGRLVAAEGATCSAAVVGGMIAMLAEKKRARTGKGFGAIGPAIYQAAERNPASFVDITAGNNSCSRVDCCRYGFQAVSGWDPVTGLGTPDYTELYRGLFPEDFAMPPFALTPGVKAPAKYASRDSLPHFIIPFTVVGCLVSVAITVFFARRMEDKGAGGNAS